MTVDEALALIEQERLDVLAEGMPAELVNNTAAYVLASAVRKDRKFILSLHQRAIQAEIEYERQRTSTLKAVESVFLKHHAVTQDQAEFANEILRQVRALMEEP